MKLKYAFLMSSALFLLTPHHAFSEDGARTEKFMALLKKANQGDIDAKIKMATMYLENDGKTHFTKEGIKILYNAFPNANDKQQSNIISTIEQSPHEDLLLPFLKKLAKKDNIDAQIELGNFYFDQHEDTREKNISKGMKWLNRAATKANKEQIKNIIDILIDNQSSSEKYNPGQHAIELALQFAQHGTAEDAYFMGNLYQKIDDNDNGQNTNQAKIWYKKAAQQGNLDAKFKLGQIIYTGYGKVSGDTNTALYIFTDLANNGYDKAQCELIQDYDRQGTKAGYKAAIFWAQKAYATRIPCGVEYLGKIYTEGKIVPQNYKTALSWYRKGKAQLCYYGGYKYEIKNIETIIQTKKNTASILAKAKRTNSPDLLIQYGQQLIDGKGIIQNEKQGLLFLLKAADLGSTKAKNAIAENYDRRQNKIYNHGLALLWFYRAGAYNDLDMQSALNHQSTDTSNTTTTGQDNYQNKLPKLVETYLKSGEIHKALSFLETAAQKNNDQALLSLVILYAQGKYIPKDQNKARSYLIKAFYNHDDRWFFQVIISNITHAQTPDDYIKAQILLDSFFEKLKNDAKECNKAGIEAIKKGKPAMMCEHGLFDQPLFQAIHGLSGVIAIKLHQSQDDIKKGIQQLQEYSKLINYYEDTLRYTQGIPGILLAKLYMAGQYIPQDYQKAKNILETVIKYDNYDSSQALYLLGTIYYQGLNIQKDTRTAKDYFSIACLLRSNQDACHALKLYFPKTVK